MVSCGGERNAIGSAPDSAYITHMDTPRATQRPAGIKAPAHWTNDQVPEPQAVEHKGLIEKGRPDPVRYGDWERKGIAIDF